MAQIREFPAHSHRVLSLRTTSYLKTRIILSALAFAALIIPAAHAQLQPPLVFSSAGAVASRNDQTGLLTPVAGSPFTAANQTLAIDVQGRYLFAIGTSSIHMYEINNPTTGAYQEVANSPFASSVTNQPAYIAVEPTGQFIAVVNRVGQGPGDGLVETLQISPSAPGGPALIPVAGSGTELDSTAIGFAQPPNNKTFLIFMGANPQSSNMATTQGSEFQALSIDPSTGLITGYQQNARALLQFHPTSPTLPAPSTTGSAQTKIPPLPIRSIHKPATFSRLRIHRSLSSKSTALSPSASRLDSKV